ncbi:26S proteasome non-ATPase regulatory subunit 7-like protein A-like isoform X2 [Raphanus sativus]|uniref:26S proteasome non-ATPase regulatory subunit 7 homolog A-like isoform X2 n=1 Tax=Raphanus sativus TaxID=3726 RepID=A0A6J0MUW0_RAPSA|nr:26S proteasome non-ATPase regulatory subunit 7 homolog A-like isoform X2 [Raphanus sativus]KAJ4908686.1 26S proteasome non-ATPase regulatory subunit 7-like protein A-like isoform X2 [Raphanus sativus]
MDAINTQQISARTIEKVVVHPLVLRNIVDNHNRMAGASGKRVVGVLLGSSSRGIVGVTNSYAVPFEEDDKDPSIWSFDRNHHEYMLRMFKGLNGKEDVVGWYSTCPELRVNDLAVHTSIFRSCSCVLNPVVFVTIAIVPRILDIPTKAYYAVNEAFVHVSSEIAPPQIDHIGRSILVTELTPGGDNDHVSSIANYYECIRSQTRISVSGYDTSLDTLVLVGQLDELFQSCGSVKNIRVPRHPVTNAITGRRTTVILGGEGAAENALALDGTDMGGWILSVELLPPEVPEMAAGMSAQEYALRFVARMQSSGLGG